MLWVYVVKEGEKTLKFIVDYIFDPPSFTQYLFVLHEPQSKSMGVECNARCSIVIHVLLKI